MTRQQSTEARLILEEYRHKLDMGRRHHFAQYQLTQSPVEDAVACALATALGTLEREIDRLGVES